MRPALLGEDIEALHEAVCRFADTEIVMRPFPPIEGIHTGHKPTQHSRGAGIMALCAK